MKPVGHCEHSSGKTAVSLLTKECQPAGLESCQSAFLPISVRTANITKNRLTSRPTGFYIQTILAFLRIRVFVRRFGFITHFPAFQQGFQLLLGFLLQLLIGRRFGCLSGWGCFHFCHAIVVWIAPTGRQQVQNSVVVRRKSAFRPAHRSASRRCSPGPDFRPNGERPPGERSPV